MDQQIWDRLCGNLKSTLPPHLYHSLVEGVSISQLDESHLGLNFSDSFSKQHFEERCLPALKDAMVELDLGHLNVVLLVTPTEKPKTPVVEFAPPMPFDSKNTFDTFVVGSSNQFAHAACQAVSQQPGQCYNPLFIFGGAGLGKTHLLRAIGYDLFRQNKGRILFLTSEAFTNELIQAIRMDRMREFREKYRSGCDVLLLDDIHFLAGKERTQEEFFYTFNFLHEARRQIVITSDRYPKDIEGLEKRLQTRFEWGLVADVQPPEVETRIAILRNKADVSHIQLPNDVAEYIASHVTTNIRELEGSLHRLQAYATLTGVDINLELAQQILKDLAPKTKHELTADGILKLVALHFNVRVSDLRADKRVRKLTLPRQICMYLLRKHLLLSFPKIGEFMAKDHTTVLHSVERIARLQTTDPEILNSTTTIESLIR